MVEKKVQYQVELDTSQAQKDMADLMNVKPRSNAPPASAGPGGSSAPGGGKTSNAIQDALEEAGDNKTDAYNSVLSALGGAAGIAKMVPVISAALVASSVVSMISSVAQNVVGRISGGISSAVSGMSGQSPVSSAAGILSTVLPGSIGRVVTSLGSLTENVLSASRALSMYNTTLFTSFTKLDLVIVGFQYRLANILAPAIARIINAIEQLLPVLLEVIARISQVLLPLIERFINILNVALQGLVQYADLFVEGIKFMLEAIKSLVDYIRSIPVVGDTLKGLPGVGIDTLLSGKGLGALDKLLKGLAGDSSGVSGLASSGYTLNTALLQTMTKFAYDREASGYGAQTRLGRSVLDIAPNAPFLNGSPAAQSVDRTKNLEPGRVPRPAPAAINLRVADTIQFNIEEDRMLQELTIWKQEILGRVSSMMETKWHKIASARYYSNAGIVR